MSTLQSINLLSKPRDPLTLRKPLAAPARVDVLMLENPTPEILSLHRSEGWGVVFESFNVVPTQNGLKTHHFVRLEKSGSRTLSH